MARQSRYMHSKLADTVKHGVCLGGVLMLMFYISPVYAQEYEISGLSAVDMIKNLATQIPNLMRLVTALAYVMGMFLILTAILKLKRVGEMRTMMSQEHSIKGPLIFLVIGAMLIYLPSTVQMGFATFWTEPNPYGYLQTEDQWSTFRNASYSIIQLVGTIAFIRGLIILSQLGGHGGHPGVFGKGITHIIGGILCINIYQFIQVVQASLGISVT